MRKYLKPKAEYRMRIGQHIRMWRDLKGIKQNELAGKIGITSAALSQIENDIAQLTLQRLEDIADAMDLNPEQLLAGPQQFHHNEHSVVSKDLLNRLVVLMENMNNFFLVKSK